MNNKYNKLNYLSKCNYSKNIVYTQPLLTLKLFTSKFF